MRSRSKILLTCSAALLLGSVGFAVARAATHQLTLRLPGGGIEHITYSGYAAPSITILPMEQVISVPADPWWLAPNLGFISGDFRGISAAMNQDMRAALQNANALTALSSNTVKGTVQPMPRGSESFAVVSTLQGNHDCTREVQITGMGDDRQPQVVSHNSGDCAGLLDHGHPADAASQFLKVNSPAVQGSDMVRAS